MVLLATEERGRFLDSPLLGGVDDESRAAVFRKLVSGRAPAGTALLSQEEPNDRLWFILEGSVAVERRQPDGHVDVMARLFGPAIFGTTTFFLASAPHASILASSDLMFWTLDRAGHEALRRDNPRAAEALALAIVRVLSERFEVLGARLAELMAENGDDQPRTTELATFRTRLFEEPSL